MSYSAKYCSASVGASPSCKACGCEVQCVLIDHSVGHCQWVLLVFIQHGGIVIVVTIYVSEVFTLLNSCEE